MERRAIAVRGIVQGVGFRPFVYGLASRLGLGGFVRNQTGSVLIEVQGEAGSVDQFVQELRDRPPPLARIASIDCRELEVRAEERFRIDPSAADASADVWICPDIATCDDCVRELFDPRDRRFRYPFINCTNCGPRLTIIRGTPYDRPLTTMASFEMCAACRREYEDPGDRRFHAQPVACANCGPGLRLLDAAGLAICDSPSPGNPGEGWGEGSVAQPFEKVNCSEPSPGLSRRTGRGEKAEMRSPAGNDPLAVMVAALRSGRIVAIKGLGGFHLACDARNEAAVCELRRRKRRDDKPFAVMARDLASAKLFCHIDKAEAELLRSRAGPIVLLRKREESGSSDYLRPGVAPNNPSVGVMLPYTPLHHLLLHDLGDVPLVLTSGNRSDEPIAYLDDDAVRRLGGIADLFLTHDRPIHVRCDDSVTRVSCGRESPIRRSRGHAPLPIELPAECAEPVLAVGGQLKGTFALGRGKQAILSHHLGDLDHVEAFRAFERDVELYQRSFAIEPRVIAHDLHPDYASTRFALKLAEKTGARTIAVQHHHGHMASCMAEHGLDEPVIGVSFDGTGFGTDGAIWGGEFLVGDLGEFRRAAHLRYVAMPGGERAVKEPWRMAVAHLADAEVDCPSLVGRLDATPVRVARQAIARGVNAPLTSSAGRLFDAVAAIIGLRDRVSFEGQAAMELQWLAEQAHRIVEPYDLARPEAGVEPIQLDTRALIRAIARDMRDGVDRSVIAVRFHATLRRLIVDVCARLHKETGINRVVLSGGVFMNLLLAEAVERELCERGFSAFRHRVVPPNDGGLSLGQVAIAAKRSGGRTRG